MNSEEIKKLTDSSIEQLAYSLRQGKSESLGQYLRMIARFHRYSLHNVLLIALQKPDASHVAGFRTWQKLGRFVRKGEKGIVILAPCSSVLPTWTPPTLRWNLGTLLVFVALTFSM